MKELGHLQAYDLTLTTQTPLYIGSGYVRGKTEYLFDPRSGAVSMLDIDKFLRFLMDRGLADEYEGFMLSGDVRLSDFLRRHGVTNSDIAGFSLYRINSADALDESHSLKEIHTFVRDPEGRVYVPGSSVKGAIRTALLALMIRDENKGVWPDAGKKGEKARQMQRLEGEYLNTLELRKDKKGQRLNDAVNSIMRGISVSDSLPLSNSCIILSGKTDALPSGETNTLNLCRECVCPGTRLRFKLTLDKSVLGSDPVIELIREAIEYFADFYRKNYCAEFTPPVGAAKVSYGNSLILGGGAGFFAKTLVYQYLGMEEGLKVTAEFMDKSFSKHYHDEDEEWGISPRTMKYGKYNGKLYPYGLCEVSIL